MKAIGPESCVSDSVRLHECIVEIAIPAKLHLLTLAPFYPSVGQEERGCFVAEPLQQLQAMGVTCSVIAVESIYHDVRKSTDEFPAEWIRYPRLPGNFGLSSAGRFLSPVLLSRVRQLHRASRIDVIHAHAALPCGQAAAVLSHRLDIPFVVTVHGLDVFNSCFQQGIAAAWRRKASSRVYRSASKVICISEKVSRLLRDREASVAAEVVYNGVDPVLFAPGMQPGRYEPGSSEQPDGPAILVVGNLLAGKGHDLVIRALRELRNSYPDLPCLIIGDGTDRERFVALAKDLGVSNQVYFLGRRSRAQVAEAMRRCTVFVLPSRNEGLGCVYLEAMACGKPVIACRGQGIDDIIHHGSNGWLVPVDGLEELVKALEIMLGDPGLRARIGDAARQTILSRLTLSHQAQNLLRIYQDVSR
jgi:teichuronic acid biosynthesis glycosyltransferase TuaC